MVRNGVKPRLPCHPPSRGVTRLVPGDTSPKSGEHTPKDIARWGQVVADGGNFEFVLRPAGGVLKSANAQANSANYC